MSGRKRSHSFMNGTILSGKDLAQSLNAYFLSVSNDLPPLNPLLLPAFLPAPKHVPKIFPDEVCTKDAYHRARKKSTRGNMGPRRGNRTSVHILYGPKLHKRFVRDALKHHQNKHSSVL